MRGVLRKRIVINIVELAEARGVKAALGRGFHALVILLQQQIDRLNRRDLRDVWAVLLGNHPQRNSHVTPRGVLQRDFNQPAGIIINGALG